MKNAKLVKPSATYKQSYVNYIEELGDEERYPFPLDFDHQDFEGMLTRLNDFAAGKNLPEGYVPSSTFWLIENSEILGVTNIRHFLNEQIEFCGGHIGLGVRPKYRGSGVGTQLMQLSINWLKEQGQSPIHIHCYQSNKASASCIRKNGGVLDSEIILQGKAIQRYLVL